LGQLTDAHNVQLKENPVLLDQGGLDGGLHGLLDVRSQ
jgi:hypothetical protein